MRRGWEVGPQRKGRTWRATHRRHGAKQGAPGAPTVIRSRKRQSQWHTDESWGREKRWEMRGKRRGKEGGEEKEGGRKVTLSTSQRYCEDKTQIHKFLGRYLVTGSLKMGEHLTLSTLPAVFLEEPP